MKDSLGVGQGDAACAAKRDAARTRERILAVARTSFEEHGYDGTTVRAVAAEAGVSPNLITRYFAGKTGLFRAATAVALAADTAFPGPYDQLGARIAARVVARWRAGDGNDPLLMMLRSAGSSEAGAEALAAFLDEHAARPLIAHLRRERGCSRPEAAARAAGVNALVMGVAMARHVVHNGPLATADYPALTRWLGEMLQRVLDDPAPPRLGPLGTWAAVVG
jgi:AcrR family transcriptional regulator